MGEPSWLSDLMAGSLLEDVPAAAFKVCSNGDPALIAGCLSMSLRVHSLLIEPAVWQHAAATLAWLLNAGATAKTTQQR